MAKNSKNLSKSRYCSGVQCPKILWLEANKSEVRDDSGINQSVLDTGSAVGDLAMGYYGAFTEVPYNSDKTVMIEETQRLLKAKTSVICEAAFSHEGNLCIVDILRVFDNGVEITEVKSATDIKPVNYDDAAFQYYVLTSCGYNVKKISLMHINNKYERNGSIDLKELFTVVDCTEKIISMQKEVAENIEKINNTAEAQNEPETEIGEHCYKPYECGYISWCFRHIPKNNIFDISGSLHLDKKFDLYKKGIVTIEQLLKSGEPLNDTTRLQAETVVYDKPPTIDKTTIKTFLDTLTYPLYYLDFESLQEAVPPFDNLRPYMQIPVQYSLHIEHEKGGKLEHREFIAIPGEDPRLKIAQQLCNDIPPNVCVLAYFMGYEKTRIKELAEFLNRNANEKGIINGVSLTYSDIADHLMKIHDNIKDLMQPFQIHAYYSKELAGSYSIKEVLPALCPNVNELNYGNLDLVHNGTDAMTFYRKMGNAGDEERERIKTALLAYCRLDTLAMVRILEKLRGMV